MTPENLSQNDNTEESLIKAEGQSSSMNNDTADHSKASDNGKKDAKDSGRTYAARFSIKSFLSRKKAIYIIMLIVYANIFILFPMLTIMNHIASYDRGSGEIHEVIIEILESLFSIRNILLHVLTIVFAFVSAFVSFSYVHSKKQTDFFDSQPIRRRSRFAGIFISNIAAFAVIFVLTSVLGGLFCAARGYMNGDLFISLIKMDIYESIIFFAFFAMFSLAALVTGTSFISVLASLVFMLYEPLLSLMISGMTSVFYDFPASDLLPNYPGFTLPMLALYRTPGKWILLAIFVSGIVCTGLAYAADHFRKNENAGVPVTFGWIRHLVKAMIGLLAAALSFLILYANFGSITVSAILSGLFTLMVSIILECIFGLDIRSWKRNIPGSVAIAVIGIVLILCGRQAVKTYEYWVPDADQISSAAVYKYGYTPVFYIGTSTTDVKTDGKEYSNAALRKLISKTMHIKDVDTIVKLAKSGTDFMKSRSSGSLDVSGDQNYDTLLFIYHMKNGRTKYRALYVPQDAVKKYFIPLTQTEEFKEAFFVHAYDSDYKDKLTDSGLLFAVQYPHYDDGYETDTSAAYRSDDGNISKGFLEAYMKDLEDFDPSSVLLPSDGNDDIYIVGCASLISHDKSHVMAGFVVYNSFENTINFLTENGLDQKK
ncbi:MAG: hypothetical protein VZR00_08875 [Lachnospiraceae bacterium]|jgi:ABC-2 type transport system permease protein|nr:hypothetical protein [Lachnospiraceae bacterium]MEE3461981.1 hypothetical protein [Lachnospiraceae bacterium]